ncbi:glycosyltransferase family 2 protein [Paenibacillus chartarius]|uniref:Glycosyltransferase family 2 protein n=1 Tax=Paenibacillus chartarius TaxID=747481 RepID=A0ABV6DKR0_9BACL
MSNKVAVITRTKNRNILLKRALESVTRQTHENWVMVIVNDGGEPNAVNELVNKYNTEGKIITIHNPESVGMEAASNIGIKKVESDYIVIHDDDDSWHPTFLERTVNHLTNVEKSKNVKGVITHSTRIIERIENDTVIIDFKEPYNTWINSVTLYRMAAGNVFPPISFVFKREVIDEIGLYREDLPVLGDWDFHLRFIEKYNIDVIHEQLAYYHHRVTLQHGDYSNSVFGGNNKHLYYDTFLRNDYLRKDLEQNKVGLGFLVNIAKSFEVVHAQISPLEKAVEKIKNNKLVRKILKP